MEPRPAALFLRLEQLCPKIPGPPPHAYTQTENFYILDGEIAVDGENIGGTRAR